ncbi:hypothetical protein RJ639_019089 [Escallonia herrerae]|uniref:tRNA pseudouridine synthase n=1 Tax=Escallonia herrerae TaxID=1293975 RepID=A0AA88VA60_9ASTE|nr:hypothetical protein RJ639_019089 [Escallonia herrerae]
MQPTFTSLFQVNELILDRFPTYVNAANGQYSLSRINILCLDEGCNTRTMHQHSKRYVALKIMYFGQSFYGFASEAQMHPTIESEIFKALEKTRLTFGDKKDWQYSRCGRTDKGVSAFGQVSCCFVHYLHFRRKRGKEDGALESLADSLKSYTWLLPMSIKFINFPFSLLDIFPCLCFSEGELDYVRMLNRVLPYDIRVMGWCPAPVDLSARFSCLSREYKYFFWKENLNVSAMETAGRTFVGEHDFRNFCKMDAANVIDALLDVDQTPKKPQYKMAPEIPLVLQSCEFDSLKFIALKLHFEKECRAYKLQAAIFHEALQNCSLVDDDGSVLNDGRKKKVASYVPLISRPTEREFCLDITQFFGNLDKGRASAYKIEVGSTKAAASSKVAKVAGEDLGEHGHDVVEHVHRRNGRRKKEEELQLYARRRGSHCRKGTSVLDSRRRKGMSVLL